MARGMAASRSPTKPGKPRQSRTCACAHDRVRWSRGRSIAADCAVGALASFAIEPNAASDFRHNELRVGIDGRARRRDPSVGMVGYWEMGEQEGRCVPGGVRGRQVSASAELGPMGAGDGIDQRPHPVELEQKGVTEISRAQPAFYAGKPLGLGPLEADHSRGRSQSTQSIVTRSPRCRRLACAGFGHGGIGAVNERTSRDDRISA